MQIIQKKSTHFFKILSELDEDEFTVEVLDFCKKNNYDFKEILDIDETNEGKWYYLILVEETSF